VSDAKGFDPRQLAARVLALLEPELAAAGYDLLDVRVFRGGGRLQLRIYVDLEGGGITLDRCTRAARTAGMLLEEADIIADQYVVEVSSPGIRRPLRTEDHFRAAVGQKVDLKTGDGRVQGILRDVDPAGLHVERALPEGAVEDDVAAVVVVPVAEVLEGNLDPEFDAQALINADRRRRKEERRAKRAQRPGKSRGRPKKGKVRTDGDTAGAADNKDLDDD